jgi:glutathione S-transferase
VIPIKSEHLHRPEFLATNPNGSVPTVKHGNVVLWESGAIMAYLLQFANDHTAKFESKCTSGSYARPPQLIPSTWTPQQWARHHMYTYWTIATIDEMMIGSAAGIAGKIKNSLTGATTAWFNQTVAPVMLEHLGENHYINGTTFTATDVYVGFSLYIADKLLGISQFQPLQLYLQRLMKRKAFKEAFKDATVIM